MKTITQRELRNDSGAVLRAVEAGESMVITKSGIPVAELHPITRRRAVPAQEWLRRIKALPRVDASLLREDIDAAVDQDLPDPFEPRHG